MVSDLTAFDFTCLLVCLLCYRFGSVFIGVLTFVLLVDWCG